MSRAAALALVGVLAGCGPAAGPGPGPVAPPVTPVIADPFAGDPPPAAAPAFPAQTATPQELRFPDDGFRATQPAPGPDRPFTPPAIQRFTLANGLAVYLVEQHAVPLVSMHLDLAGGAITDPAGKEGRALVCTALLAEGTVALDKREYTAALGKLASAITARALEDRSRVALASLTRHVESTLIQLADTARRPGWRAPDFARLVKREIEAVRQARATPSYVGWRVMTPALYGASHPLGRVTTETSLGALTIEDCKAYAAAYLQPAGARLFVVGDLTAAELRTLLATAGLAAWTGKPRRVPPVPKPRPLAGRIFFVHVAGAAQSSVSQVEIGPKRTARDYLPTSLVVSVLGGTFASRNNLNLREARGYTYGALTEIRYSKQSSLLETNSAVRTDATYQAVLELDRELAALTDGTAPITAAELASERRAFELAQPALFATAEAALDQYADVVYFGLPLDYFATYVARLRKVTPRAANAAAVANLKRDRMVYVIAGDGDAKVITRGPVTTKDPVTGKDVTADADIPYMKDGAQLTLREALVELAARGTLGTGGFVELDLDGRPR